MARTNPEPTEAQRKAAEQRLLQDVDKALGKRKRGHMAQEAMTHIRLERMLKKSSQSRGRRESRLQQAR